MSTSLIPEQAHRRGRSRCPAYRTTSAWERDRKPTTASRREPSEDGECPAKQAVIMQAEDDRWSKGLDVAADGQHDPGERQSREVVEVHDLRLILAQGAANAGGRPG